MCIFSSNWSCAHEKSELVALEFNKFCTFFERFRFGSFNCCCRFNTLSSLSSSPRKSPKSWDFTKFLLVRSYFLFVRWSGRSPFSSRSSSTIVISSTSIFFRVFSGFTSFLFKKDSMLEELAFLTKFSLDFKNLLRGLLSTFISLILTAGVLMAWCFSVEFGLKSEIVSVVEVGLVSILFLWW